MSCFSCATTSRFRELSHAMAKSAGARLRNLGALPTSPNWGERAAICERCPLRYLRAGISYCGKPFLEQVDRDPIIDGCGCPTREKAKSPSEHCPLTARHLPAARTATSCDCKWCAHAIR